MKRLIGDYVVNMKVHMEETVPEIPDDITAESLNLRITEDLIPDLKAAVENEMGFDVEMEYISTNTKIEDVTEK